MLKILLIRILLGAVLAVFLNPTTAMANGGPQNYDVVGTEATWRWSPYDDCISELMIDENGGDFVLPINEDGFDTLGYVKIGEVIFNTNGASATISGGSVTFTDTDHPGDTVNYQFQDNWWQTTVSLDTAGSIKLSQNLGSDSRTVWTTINGKLFSYENLDNFVRDDPIFYWSTPPSTYTNDNDNPELAVSGTSLTLKLHAFAHQQNTDVNHIDYMAKFAQFASENVNRTDVFNYETWSPAPAPAPAPVYVRQSSNLTFAQSLYASDTLSDPDGQLRATVDQVMSKYGSLIK
jgi:hypothetical protein